MAAQEGQAHDLLAALGLCSSSESDAVSTSDKLISQGAEARVFKLTVFDRETIVKQRFNKRYRLPELDAKLTKARLQAEVRSMLKASKLGVLAPTLYYVDLDSSSLFMEFVPGVSVKDRLLQGPPPDGTHFAELAEIASKIGKAISLLHDGGVVHGDLTTSNMVLRAGDGRLARARGGRRHALIDFGLSSISALPEDKAVDLYVLERAIASAHAADAGPLFDGVIEEYRRSSRLWNPVLNKFAEVRMRGRKRSMVG